ncbi:hypothetical protein Tco_0123064 [Tanacetum coccineum]
MSFLTSIYSLGDIMDEVDIEDLTIEQYLRLIQESQTPKKIEDMTIADTPTPDPIQEFAHYFDPNQPDTKSDCDSEDMEEEVKYMTDDKVVMNEQEESNHGYTQNIQHFEEKYDVDEWLNAEITKHMSMHSKASTGSISDEVSSIASNEVDKDDKNTSDTSPYVKDNIMPLKVTYNDGSGEDCEMWPTCDPDSKFCFGYKEVFGVRYGQQNIDDTTRERRYYEWVAQNYEFSKHRTLTSTNLNDPISTPQVRQEQGDDEPRPIRPRPCNYSFQEWMKIRENGKKGYVLDDVWEKCQQNYKKTNEAWHDEAYEEDEMWRIRDDKTDYDPPYVHVKTFEVKKYSFKGGRSFICITDREDEALPIGRVNGARFKAMIRKELEGHKYVHEVT